MDLNYQGKRTPFTYESSREPRESDGNSSRNVPAKTNLSSLIAKVAQGDEVVILESGKPIARLSPIVEEKPKRILGRDAGLFEVPEVFDAPLPNLLSSFHS
jgi:antitoxin (DNA-binding transcriptional repressor) of toxin-antitoxin stability system